MGGRARIRSTARRLRALDPALLLLAAMVFVVQVGVAVMLPLLPLYALSLGASPFVLGLLTSVFALTNAGGQLMTASWPSACRCAGCLRPASAATPSQTS